MRRVVVTGLGVVAPNGIGKDAFWSACVEGRSGVGPIRSFDASAHPVNVAAEVPDFDITPFVPGPHRKSVKIMGRAVRFRCGRRRPGCSGLWPRSAARRPRTHRGGHGNRSYSHRSTGSRPDARRRVPRRGRPDEMRSPGPAGVGCAFPLWLLKYLPNMIAAHISLVHGAQGPNNTLTTACAAGTQAVGEAFRLIARGDADLALAGGADSRMDPLLLLAYAALGALSPARRSPELVSRPFDGNRDGFVLGEGAGVLMLEELDRAKNEAPRSMPRSSGSAAASTPMPSPSRTPTPAAPPVPFAGRSTMPVSPRAISTTSMPTAQAPGSTTRWKRSPSKRSSAKAPARYLCPPSNRWSAI